MPTYHYACKECKEEFEVFHSIKEPLRTICPFCEKAGLSVVLDEPPVIINKEVKTIGQLAEKNAKSLGRYGLEEKMAKDSSLERIKHREKRELNSKIAKLSPEKQRKFIETGKL
jgi:putative FmdB family regulatory protein